MEVRLQHRSRAGVVERLVFQPSGQPRVVGYSMTARASVPLILRGENLCRGPLFVGRTHRLDLTGDLRVPDEFLGWEALFDLPTDPAAGPLQLLFDGQIVWQGTPPHASGAPPPELDPAAVPSLRSVPPALAALLKDVRGPVLDLHCGAGTLVRYLRSRGVEAEGLEIDAPGFRDALPADVRPHIRTYEGTLPLPFAEAAFSTTTAIDVLQRLPEPERFLAELARLTREEALITVPDGSPTLFANSAEAHAFSPQGLESLLRRHFADVEFYLFEPVELAGKRIFTHLGARARRH